MFQRFSFVSVKIDYSDSTGWRSFHRISTFRPETLEPKARSGKHKDSYDERNMLDILILSLFFDI